MANLRVDKITSTETFETTGSVQFGGTNGDYLSHSCLLVIFQFGSGDFTIEVLVLSSRYCSNDGHFLYTRTGDTYVNELFYYKHQQ